VILDASARALVAGATLDLRARNAVAPIAPRPTGLDEPSLAPRDAVIVPPAPRRPLRRGILAPHHRSDGSHGNPRRS
jgi:hypothetical protein